MARQTIPTQPSLKTSHYTELLGIDYQLNETEISRRRSPEMVNMISDLGGNPIKRCGYRSIGGSYKGFTEINGSTWAVYEQPQGTNPQTYHLVACRVTVGSSITHVFEKKLSTRTNYGTVNKVFSFGSNLYVLCSHEWIEYDTSAGTVRALGLTEGTLYNIVNNKAELIKPNDRYIPTVMTMYKPNGKALVTLPAGTDISGATEGVNAMTPFRRVEYCVTTDTASQVKFTIPRCAATAGQCIVEVLDPDTFEWTSARVFARTLKYIKGLPETYYIRDPLTGTGTIKIDAYEPYVELYQPYKKVTVDGVDYLRFYDKDTVEVPAGVPNVRITYVPFDTTEKHTTDDPTVVATETPMKSPAEGQTVTFVMSHDPCKRDGYKTIQVFRDNVELSPAVTFTAGTASSSLGYSYNGSRTITYTKPAGASGGIGVVKYNAYAVYAGIYKKNRTQLFASDITSLYDSRLFVANGVHSYYSRAGNPFKIDDNYYFDVDNRVMAYATTSSYLAVICKDTGRDTMYIAQGSYNESYNMPVYSVKTSNASVGAIAKKVTGVLNDEPLLLSKTGIYGISTNYYSEKYAISRSGKINRRLCEEPNLANAVGIAFNNYFYLAVNGRMYVLDGRHRDASRNGDNSYECYLFTGMPSITGMYIADGTMLMSDGSHIYRWNDDLSAPARYKDNDGSVVTAKWTSALDDDGAPQYYKVLNKKGTMFTLSPPMQTSCLVTIVKDAHERYYIGRFDGSIFALSDSVLDGFTKKKIKKYKRLQFVLENDKPEPFGLISITKTYTIGNLSKR